MNLTLARRSLLALSIVFVALLSSTPASTLIYTSSTADGGQQLLLRRDGDRLVIVDQLSRAIVASAPAGSTRRVVIAGADDRNDTLTLDLSSPISLPRGIDYDGGARGWDTLVVRGGSVQKETVTQLTPHDGVFDLDGLSLRYTNLEPITDTAPAASLTVNGTAGTDTVTIADGPGVGEATISSPTFESYTFANKTNLVFDGLGGGDGVTLDNPSTPAGLASLIIQNVDTVDQISPFTYPRFGVSADRDVILDQVGANNVNNIEIVTQIGAIGYRDADAVAIGGVSPSLTGLRVVTDGGISFVSGGTITLRDLDGPDIVHSGDAGGGVVIVANGIGADIDIPFNNKAITAPAGFIQVTAGGDINVGTGGDDFGNDILAWGDVTLNAARDIVISGSSQVFSDAFGFGTGGTAAANASRDFLVSNTTGANARFGSNGLGGGTVQVVATGSVILTAPEVDALFANSGPVTVTTGRLIIDPASGISAPAQPVFLTAASGALDLGSTTDVGAALEISDAEIDRITASSLVLEGGSSVTATQPITFAGDLTLRGSNIFTASGAGSLNAPALTFVDLGSAPRTWTIDATGVTISPGTLILYSGVTTLTAGGSNGDDTFNVTPSPTTAIVIAGRTPDLDSFTPPGDTLNVDTSGTTSPFLTSTQTETGFDGSYTFGNRAPITFGDIETLGATTDLAITKTDGATTEIPGTPVSYTIVASNGGAFGIGNVTVVDAFPAAITGVTWTCTASPGSTCPSNGAGDLNTLVDLAAGGTATFTATGTINPAATGMLSNTATVALPGGTTDPAPGNNSATDDDLLLTVTTISTTASTGVTLGGQIHDTATLAHGLGAVGSITFRAYGPDDATCAGSPAFTAVVPVAGNGSYASGNFTPSQEGTYRWIASYSGDTTNAPVAGACNDANESVTVTRIADVAVTKTGPATVVGGSNITYAITVSNSGPSSATGVTVTDTLPAGTTFVSATPTQGSCSGTSTVTCALGTINNGATVSIALVVSTTGPTSSSISNTATVSTTATDPAPGNNSSTANTTRTCPTLNATPAVLPPATAADPYSQTFALTNGTAPVTFTLTGTLPAGLSFSGDALSGVPAERGAFPVTLNATDANGCTGSFTYTVTISRDRSLVIGAGEGGGSRVRSFGVFSWTPRLDTTIDPPYLTGGVSVAQGDFNGDGVTDVLTGAGPGNDPVARVIDGATGVVSFTILAYAPSYRSGIEVAAGDVNGDGIMDIITVPGYGGPPVIRVFNSQTGALIREFFGMPPTWTNGMHLAAGDVNGDGLADIIVGSGPFGPPLVQVFDSASGALMGQFLAYAPEFESGVYVASGDVNGDGFADIVTGPGYGGGPHVKVFDGTTGDPIAGPLGGFFAYTPDFAGGVRVGAGDFDGDGFAEVITSAGPGGGPHVRVWDGATGAETFGVYGFDPSFPYGAFVAGPPAMGRMAIDLLQVGGATPGNIRIAGWAFVETSTAGPGTDAIHAWAYPVGGGSPVFVGAATSQAPRPDVAAAFGGEFLLSGFDFTGTLAPGTYDLVIFVRDDTTHLFNQRRGGRITVP